MKHSCYDRTLPCKVEKYLVKAQMHEYKKALSETIITNCVVVIEEKGFYGFSKLAFSCTTAIICQIEPKKVFG